MPPVAVRRPARAAWRQGRQRPRRARASGRRARRSCSRSTATSTSIYAHLDELKGKTPRRRSRGAGGPRSKICRASSWSIRTDVELPVDLAGHRRARKIPDVDEDRPSTRSTASSSSTRSSAAAKSGGRRRGRGRGLRDHLARRRSTRCSPASAGAAVAFHCRCGTRPPSSPARLVGHRISRRRRSRRFVPLHGGEGALADDAGAAMLKTWLEDADRPKVAHDVRDQWTLLSRFGVELDAVVVGRHPARLVPHRPGPRIIPHPIEQVVARVPAPARCPRRRCARQRQEAAPLRRRAAVGAGRTGPVTSRRRGGGDVAAGSPALASRSAQTRTCCTIARAADGAAARRACSSTAFASTRRCSTARHRVRERKAEVEAEIYELAGKEFNVGSTKQLAEACCSRSSACPVIKRTKTGYSTAAEVLERLAPEHAIARPRPAMAACARQADQHLHARARRGGPPGHRPGSLHHPTDHRACRAG